LTFRVGNPNFELAQGDLNPGFRNPHWQQTPVGFLHGNLADFAAVFVIRRNFAYRKRLAFTFKIGTRMGRNSDIRDS
jgi:hypothetical protein